MPFGHNLSFQILTTQYRRDAMEAMLAWLGSELVIAASLAGDEASSDSSKTLAAEDALDLVDTWASMQAAFDLPNPGRGIEFIAVAMGQLSHELHVIVRYVNDPQAEHYTLPAQLVNWGDSVDFTMGSSDPAMRRDPPLSREQIINNLATVSIKLKLAA